MSASTSSHFYGRVELPKIFQKYNVLNFKRLMEVFDQKYHWLKPYLSRTPSVPLYPGSTKIQSLETKLKEENEFNFFMTWIDEELDSAKKRLFIVIYGLSEFGNVVRLYVDGIRPYFYVEFPFWIFDKTKEDFIRNYLQTYNFDALRKSINNYLFFECKDIPDFKKNKVDKFGRSYGLNFNDFVVSLEVEWNLKGVGYEFDIPEPFLKITLLLSEFVYILTNLFKSPKKWLEIADYPLKSFNEESMETPWNIWDKIEPLPIIFLKDHGLKCSEWWTISNIDTYSIFPQFFNVDMVAECEPSSFKSVSKDHPLKNVLPNDIIFLFDGEMLGENNKFANAQRGDPIGQLGIQIIQSKSTYERESLVDAYKNSSFFSILLSALPVKNFESVYNDPDNKYPVKSVSFIGQNIQKPSKKIEFVPIEEYEMLCCFCELVLYSNPSYIIAYNGNRFDWPYVIDRMYDLYHKPLEFDRPFLDWKISDYCPISRDLRLNRGIFHKKAKKVTTAHLAKASARIDYDKVKIHGIINLDLFLYVKTFAKYGMKASYSLDAASSKYLKEKKIEINYNFIPYLFATNHGRMSIAKYCNRDVELMTRLITTLGSLTFIAFLGKMAMIPPQLVIDRGIQFHVDCVWYSTPYVYDHLSLYSEENGMREYMRQVFESFKEEYFPNQKTRPKFLLPAYTFYLKDIEGPGSKGAEEKGGGADVIEPPAGKVGPALTLDFASLYPSIIMTFNLCNTTIIPHKRKEFIMQKVKELANKFNIPKNEIFYKRKESWYCTGDNPKSFPTLKDAISFLRSEQCNYNPELKKILNKMVNKLEQNTENEPLIKKWEPLIMFKLDEIDESLFTAEDKKDDTMIKIFLEIAEPIAKITGMTKVQYKNDKLPIFVKKMIRFGIWPKREEEFFQERVLVKKDMAKVNEEIERLLREKVPEDSSIIKKLKAEGKKFDIIQQAIKQLMNSIYGWMSSKLLMKFSLQETICVIGQMLLGDTKCFIDTMCKKVVGFIGDAITGYGDTDSDFFTFLRILLYEETNNFFFRIMKFFQIRSEHLFNSVRYLEICNGYELKIDENINRGFLLEKYRSKAILYIKWKLILDDVHNQRNLFNVLRLGSNEILSIEELNVIGNLKEWYDNFLIHTMKVDFNNIESSAWNNIRFSPSPVKIDKIDIVEPLEFQLFLRWIFINRMFDHGRRVEKIVNIIFKLKYNGVIKQELEKIYEYIIWWRKKKYAGLKWMPNASEPEIAATGIDMVRGDCFSFKADNCKKIMNMTLTKNDDEGAIDYGYESLSTIMSGKVMLHELTQSKNIKKDLTEYGQQKQTTSELVVTIGENEIHVPAGPEKEEEISVKKGMPVHIVGAITRHLKYGEPLPQIDERYYFVVVHVPGEKNVGNKIVPPYSILNSGGLIEYDREYYAKNCARQISRLIYPLFDKRPFLVKMEEAEIYRRIKDKKKRSEIIEKSIRKKISDLSDHFMNFIGGSQKMKDKSWFKNERKKLYVHSNQLKEYNLLNIPTCSSSRITKEEEERLDREFDETRQRLKKCAEDLKEYRSKKRKKGCEIRKQERESKKPRVPVREKKLTKKQQSLAKNHDIRNLFGLPISKKEENIEKEKEKDDDHHIVETIILEEYDDHHNEQKIEDDFIKECLKQDSKKLDFEEIIEIIDDYARLVPFCIDANPADSSDQKNTKNIRFRDISKIDTSITSDILESLRKSHEDVEVVNNINDDDDLDISEKKPLKCFNCGSELKSLNLACEKCSFKRILNSNQIFITDMFKRSRIKCILCSRISNLEICARCEEEKDVDAEMKSLLMKIQEKQINEDCNRCAKCFGVSIPTTSFSSDSSIESYSNPVIFPFKDLDHNFETTKRIVDQEKTIEDFMNSNEPIKFCSSVNCENRWKRAQNERRKNIISMVMYERKKSCSSSCSLDDDHHLD